MAEAENQNRSIQEFKTVDYVMLSLERIQLPVWAVSKCRKLRGKYFGPFPIVMARRKAWGSSGGRIGAVPVRMRAILALPRDLIHGWI